MSDFSDVLTGRKHNIVSAIYANLQEMRIVEPIDITKNVWFRSSGIFNMCPFFEYLHYIHKRPCKEPIQGKLKMIFSSGDFYHSLLQDSLKDRLLGIWECISGEKDKPCLKIYGGNDNHIKKPERCIVCGGSDFKYVEPYLFNAEFKIGGHTDGLFPNEVFEIKTFNDYRYGKFLEEVIDDQYVWQANTYMALSHRESEIMVGVNKNTCEVEEHRLEFDQKILDKIKYKCGCTIDAITKVSSDELSKDMRKCATYSEATKKCIYAKECFRIK